MKNSMKLIGIITIVVMVASSMISIACDDSDADITVTGVSLNKQRTYILVGQNEILTASVTPSNATIKDVTWSSSNPEVATVTEGIVIGMKAGSAAITATTIDGGKIAACAVTVSASAVAVTGVSLNKTALSLAIGGTETLTAVIAPDDATNQNVTWGSGNTAVATVSNGTITGKAAGTAVITVSTEDGGYTATCTVTISSAVAVTGVSLNKTSASIAVGSTETLSATVSPSAATNKAVTWRSGNTAVATVSSSGVVTGIAAGSATITVTTTDGNRTASCAVTVTSGSSNVPVTSVTIDKTTLVLAVGATERITATVLPANATNKSLTWTSSPEGIVTVSEDGVVTGKAAGNAVITATPVSGVAGLVPATCNVSVSLTPVRVTGVTLNKSSTHIQVGGDHAEMLIATVEPPNATNKDVTWKSSDTTVATVSLTGLVTGIADSGSETITITVTTADGGFYKTCTVKVSDDPVPVVPVSSVTLNKTTLSLTAGASEKLTATVAPPGATNQNVTWSSSNDSIATVSSSGVVTGVSLGTATITVTAVDNSQGNKTATCTVTIPLSASTLATYLGTLSANPATPHVIALNVNNSGEFTLINQALTGAPSKYVNLILSGSAITNIRSEAFKDCTSLAGITMPSTITSIQSEAFSGCTRLSDIIIPGNVTSIQSEAFSGCTSLSSVTIPGSVRSIGADAFRGCTSLTYLPITSGGVTSIGINAFRDCTGLTSASIPSGVTSIGGNAFYGCTKLASASIPSGITSIGDNIFNGCTSLASVTMAGSVTSIGVGSFRGCSKLESIPIPNGLTSIGASAFQSSGLKSVTIPASVDSIGNSAFNGCTALASVKFDGTISSSGFSTSAPFLGDLRAKYFANGPGTYTTSAPVSGSSEWTRH